MKFTEIAYARPDIPALSTEMKALIGQFKEASTMEEQASFIEKINHLRSEYDTSYQVASVRHSIDTTDEMYRKENDYFDETGPEFSALVDEYYRALVDSKFKDELKDKFGEQLFVIAELSTKSFEPEIIEDLKSENKEGSAYTQLIASAKVDFRGEEFNLSLLEPHEESPDRETRKEASTTKFSFFAKHEEQFDEHYDKLVKVRTQMAQKLGHKNFVELGYHRMLRSDYDANMVSDFRQAVLDYIVPISNELRDRQAKRIGVDKLKFYDLNFYFNSGNPKPKGDPNWIVDNGKKMYAELSSETDEFFSYMLNNELMDLVTRKGKAAGGYCTMLPKYKHPFIFSNFNGTSGDIDVLTHEAGHAFQVFSSRNQALMEYYWPTYEACEIHSMSMEYFTWKWMNLFFQEDTDKYKFSHLMRGILFIPYGVTVDEFQHKVYENPNMTPEERKSAWRSIEQKYTPYKDYDGNDYLERGGYWQRQQHIYRSPFYYIDYTLAQICAFQFWLKMQQDFQGAWNDYLRLCKAGGSLPFLELVKLANLDSPFDPETIKRTAAAIKEWLDQVDDSAF